MYKAQKKVLLSGYQKSRAWLFIGPHLEAMLEIANKYAKWILKSEEAFGDLMVIQEKTIKIPQVRKISEFLNLTSSSPEQKVIIISHFELMTLSAANALLKILEEGTQSVTIILIAEHAHHLINTIRSRCFYLYFPPSRETNNESTLLSLYRELLETALREEHKSAHTKNALIEDHLPKQRFSGKAFRESLGTTKKLSEAELKNLLCFIFNRVIRFQHGLLGLEVFLGEKNLLKELGQSPIFWHHRWLQLSEALAAPKALYVEKSYLLRIALTQEEI